MCRQHYLKSVEQHGKTLYSLALFDCAVQHEQVAKCVLTLPCTHALLSFLAEIAMYQGKG